MFIFGKNGVVTLVKMRNQIAELKMEIKSKHQQIEQLKEEINALKSDPVYIESQARRAGMLKNGEQIVKFVSKEKIADR
jgi:cell division protein FtsB